MEQSDFQNEDSKNYYGLAPGKSVLLRYEPHTYPLSSLLLALNLIHLWLIELSAVCRYTFPIKCTNVVFADDTKTVCEIYVEYDPEKKIKPKVHSLTISIHSAVVRHLLIVSFICRVFYTGSLNIHQEKSQLRLKSVHLRTSLTPR